jgi:hypothetical protein
MSSRRSIRTHMSNYCFQMNNNLKDVVRKCANSPSLLCANEIFNSIIKYNIQHLWAMTRCGRLRPSTPGDGNHPSIRFAWGFPGIQPAAGGGNDDAKIPSALASFRFGEMEGLLEPATGPPPAAAANYLARRAEQGGGEWMAAPPQGSPSEQHEVAGKAAGAPRRRGAASGARRRRGQLDGRASKQEAPWPWPDGGEAEERHRAGKARVWRAACKAAKWSTTERRARRSYRASSSAGGLVSRREEGVERRGGRLPRCHLGMRGKGGRAPPATHQGGGASSRRKEGGERARWLPAAVPSPAAAGALEQLHTDVRKTRTLWWIRRELPTATPPHSWG